MELDMMPVWFKWMIGIDVFCIINAVVLFMVMAIRGRKNPYYVDWADEPTFTLSLFLTVMAFVLSIANPVVASNGLKTVDVRYDLASLERESGVEGHFTLGFGYVESKMNYYVYESHVTAKGETAYCLLVIRDAEKVMVIETDEISPCEIIKKEKWQFKETRTIYVPVGTVRKEFRL